MTGGEVIFERLQAKICEYIAVQNSRVASQLFDLIRQNVSKID
jgi:hypothetical protein